MNGMNRDTGKPLAGLDHLRQSIADILGTPLGTRVCRRDYGSLLPELLDQPMTSLTRIRLYAAAALALSRQEPRVRVSRIAMGDATTASGAELVIAGVARDPAGRRTRFNFSLPVRARSALNVTPAPN